MTNGAGWVDEVCRELRPGRLSPWLPWAEREKDEALGGPDAGDAVAGIFILGWGDCSAALQVVYVGEADDLRSRLRQLEGSVKWRQQQGPQRGFDALRDFLEMHDDQRTMRRVWVRVVAVEEEPLFASPVLDRRRLAALGARRRQLQAILLAEHVRRFGFAPIADCRVAGLARRRAAGRPEAQLSRSQQLSGRAA